MVLRLLEETQLIPYALLYKYITGMLADYGLFILNRSVSNSIMPAIDGYAYTENSLFNLL